MVQVVLAFNAIHLEAARRIRHSQPADALRFELLLYEPSRLALEAGDRRLWPWRWPINPLSMAALALAALISQWSFEQGQLHPQRTWWWSAMSAQIL